MFEELCVQAVLPNLPEPPALNMLVEYSEDTGAVEMRLKYNGNTFDPAVSGDKLPMTLVRNATDSIRYRAINEGDMRNEVILLLK